MKGKILVGFTLAIASLTLVGFFAYKSLSQLVSTLYTASQPNQKIILHKDVMVDLSDAESSVRAYMIVKESGYLKPYYRAISTIDNKLGRLEKLSQDSLSRVQIDSLKALIDTKFTILNELIELKKDDSRLHVLKKVLADLDSLQSGGQALVTENHAPSRTNKANSTQEEEKEEKQGIFQRIFGSKDKVEKAQKNAQPESSMASETTQPHTKKEQVPDTTFSDRVRTSVEEIRDKELSEQQLQKKQELALTRHDKNIMDNIRDLINEIEAHEAELSQARVQDAEEDFKSTTKLIATIGVFASITLVVLVLVVFNDISVNKRNRRKLEAAKARAEKLARVKDEFLSNMSHEIRTPMNSILGFAEQLERTTLDKGQKFYLGAMKNSSNHLLTIINDVLDYTKMESGQVSLERIGFRPRQHMDEIMATLQPQANNKSLALDYEISGLVPEVLVGDPVRLKQILINLINNAIKFTESGHVQVYCLARQLSEDQVEMHFSVKDTGIGIPKEKVDSIFLDFNQVDNSTTRKYGGTGLGLSITKKLIELQKGTLNVISKEGEGSTFSFALPYDIGREEDVLHNKPTWDIDPELLKNKSILIADDEEYNLTLFRTILEKWGASVTTVTTGSSAVEQVQAGAFDIILMDIQMPNMDGLDATRKIREEVSAEVPILALSAASSQGGAQICYDAGMNDFLQKPVAENYLVHKLAVWLGAGAAEKEAETEATQTTSVDDGQEADDAKPYDLRELIRVSDGDEGFVANMVRLFIKNISEGIEDMQKACARQDWATVQEKAHKSVPPCRHLGVQPLADSFKAIENNITDDRPDGEKAREVSEVYEKATAIIEALKVELKSLKESKA